MSVPACRIQCVLNCVIHYDSLYSQPDQVKMHCYTSGIILSTE